MCPATGGAYNHKRAKFFGMYSNKAVRRVALIDAVVDVETAVQGKLKWKNVKTPASDLVAEALKRHRRWRPDSFPVRVFILGEPVETSYRKKSKGGMQTSKRYFDVAHHDPKDAADLADKLRDKTWT